MHTDPARPPVLLLGGGLNLLRALGLAGIPAVVASPDPDAPSRNSCYCGDYFGIPPPHHPEALVEALLPVGERMAGAAGCRIPLFYGNDDYLNLVDAFREPLARHFRLLLNEPDIARALIDKDRFEALARNRGFAVPRTLAWDDASPDSLAHARGPVLVKPKMKVGWEDSAVHLRLFNGAGKARIFASGPEVMADPLARQLREQLAFQEFIPGDDRHLWSFHGFADENGAILAWFIGRKLRTFPALTGMSTYLELAHDDELAALGRDIVARVPLKGVFKIDFKRDAQTGRLRVLEINARFNLWHYMAARNGVNLLQVAYEYLTSGARPPAARHRTTFRWLCLRLDYRAYREAASRGELTLGAWLGSIARSRMVYDLFSWTDPVPFVRYAADRVRSRLRRSLDHLRTWLRQWLSTAF
jgi:D-aspartate ligase